MMFEFVEGDPGKEEADQLISKLTKRTEDISFFLELLKEMTEILRGDDRKKLNLLIDHDIFYRFYRKKLFSLSKHDKLLACVYFEHSGSIDHQAAERLLKLSESHNLKLAYGATKALQASKSLSSRKDALSRFLKRDDPSDLMVSELLHYFHQSSMGQHREVAKSLKEIVTEKKIAPEKKKLVVLYLAYQNFYEQSNFLLKILKKLHYSAENAPLIIGLVEALGQLHVVKAAPVIRKYVKIKDDDLRLKCVEALGRLGEKENLAFLAKQLLMVNFSVRKAIIKILAQNYELGLPIMNKFLITNQKFISRIKHKGSTKDTVEIIRNIHNTGMGIKIALSKIIVRGHV